MIHTTHNVEGIGGYADRDDITIPPDTEGVRVHRHARHS